MGHLSEFPRSRTDSLQNQRSLPPTLMSSLYPKVETSDVAKTVPDSKVAPETKGAKPEYSTAPGPQLENRRCRDKLFLVLFFLSCSSLLAWQSRREILIR